MGVLQHLDGPDEPPGGKIQSRCQRFDFKRVGSDTIAARLLHIAGEEAIPLEQEAAELIGRLATW